MSRVQIPHPLPNMSLPAQSAGVRERTINGDINLAGYRIGASKGSHDPEENGENVG